jgi:hypothetical protein
MSSRPEDCKEESAVMAERVRGLVWIGTKDKRLNWPSESDFHLSDARYPGNLGPAYSMIWQAPYLLSRVDRRFPGRRLLGLFREEMMEKMMRNTWVLEIF